MEQSLDNYEVEKLISDIDKEGVFNAASFADELPGSLWDLPDSKFGWRRKAQEWGVQEKLIKAETEEGEAGGTFITLTDRGKAFKEALRRKGITVFVSHAK